MRPFLTNTGIIAVSEISLFEGENGVSGMSRIVKSKVINNESKVINNDKILTFH